MRRIFFYPHTYMRDRQLDTIRHWPPEQVMNPEVAERGRSGAQVNSAIALKSKMPITWRQRLPLFNLKRRPKTVLADTVVYVWGAVIASGPFIVDLDNPYSLTGYNLPAMALYRPILKRLLLSDRCQEIRCISQACRSTLKLLFGDRVHDKASVHYPYIRKIATLTSRTNPAFCRFLFVGTQFEIKGGAALIRAFHRLYEAQPGVRLDMITHLPEQFSTLVRQCPGIRLHQANFSRDELHRRFMADADVLVLPTYVESFGMVVLEALAHGLAVVATDVYALREMVENDVNGSLIAPPISIWQEHLPTQYYYDLAHIKDHISATDTSHFEDALFQAMLKFAQNSSYRLTAKQGSQALFKQHFAAKEG